MSFSKKKKNIGILFPYLKKGGVFQYALSIVDGLINFSDNFNYFVLHYDTENPKECFQNKDFKNLQFICLDSSFNSFWGKLKFLLNLFLGNPIFSTNIKNREVLKNINLDLLISPIPSLLAFENKIPFVVSVVDTMHKYYPNFPEYPFLGRLKRDIIFKFSTKYSILTIVDSEQGLSDVNKFYKAAKEKIRIIPYIPPGYIYRDKDMDSEAVDRLLKKYNLPESFLFYPAQFWYQKNHQRLIKALHLIKKNLGVKIPLVLVGDPGANYHNYRMTMELVKEFNIEDQIFNLDYVSNKEIIALYKKSKALIFPTLIGPTSIPPLEAMVLGTPVLCSNLFEMPKQIGRAGIFFNPFSEQDMAEKIYQVWTDESLRKELIKAGEEKAKEITLENYAQKWQSVINKALNYGK